MLHANESLLSVEKSVDCMYSYIVYVKLPLFSFFFPQYSSQYKFTLWLQLNNTNFERLCNSKSMLVVNGTFPGPTIAVRKGDTAYVNVHNNGDYGVTIHW